jgi:hypothetical protein
VAVVNARFVGSTDLSNVHDGREAVTAFAFQGQGCRRGHEAGSRAQNAIARCGCADKAAFCDQQAACGSVISRTRGVTGADSGAGLVASKNSCDCVAGHLDAEQLKDTLKLEIAVWHLDCASLCISECGRAGKQAIRDAGHCATRGTKQAPVVRRSRLGGWLRRRR